jgi:TRAP-type C4-dicarboxylate transport system permease small subunit
MRRVLSAVDGFAGRVELAICVFAIVAATGSIAIGVFFRSLLDHPLAWTNELAVLGLVWMTFLGSSLLYKERGHIAVDAISHVLPARGRRLLAIALVMVMGATIAAVGWHMPRLIELQGRKMISGLDLPRSWHGVPILWMSISMTFSSIRQLFEPPHANAETIKVTG